MNINQLLAVRIREIRIKRNISLEAMAKDIGISKGAMSRLENGHVEITLMKINCISLILDVPFREFLEGIIELDDAGNTIQVN